MLVASIRASVCHRHNRTEGPFSILARIFSPPLDGGVESTEKKKKKESAVCGATVRSSAAFSNHEEKRPFFHSWGLLHEIDFSLPSCEARARENESLFFSPTELVEEKKGRYIEGISQKRSERLFDFGLQKCLPIPKKASPCVSTPPQTFMGWSKTTTGSGGEKEFPPPR